MIAGLTPTPIIFPTSHLRRAKKREDLCQHLSALQKKLLECFLIEQKELNNYDCCMGGG